VTELPPCPESVPEDVRTWLEGRFAALGREQLGGHPQDRRLDCIRCSQNLAIQDRVSAEVRGGYRGDWAVWFRPASPFSLFCKRCRCATVFSAEGEPLRSLPMSGDDLPERPTAR
jgi:hypothetical protein